jgi:mannose-6-phosphate isomerase-like protein (cupin superfamily)
MPIVDNRRVEKFTIPGIVHQTLAGHKRNGLNSVEVWRQTIAPHTGTPMHRHACEEVIVILSGRARLVIDGEVSEFGPDSTVIVPPNAVHQLDNIGDEPMALVSALGMAPVRVETPDGAPMPLPWD